MNTFNNNLSTYLFQEKITTYFNLVEQFNLKEIININMSLHNISNEVLTNKSILEVCIIKNKLIDLERVYYIPFLFEANKIIINIR